MNTKIILVLAIFISIQTNAQITFEKNYGGGGPEEGIAVRQTFDGGYIMVGYTQSFGVNSYDDVYLIKTNAGGDTMWTKTYGGAVYDDGFSVEQTTDSGYIVTGSTGSFSTGLQDVYLIKTDKNGTLLWSKTYGGNLGGTGYSVKQTNDGGYIIGGAEVNAIGVHDMVLIKTDDAGDTLWTRRYGGGGDDYCFSVLQTFDGGYMLAANGSTTGVNLIKLNSNGDTLWTKLNNIVGGPPHLNIPYCIQQTADSGYIVTGTFDGGSSMDMFALKTDVNGITQWIKSYSGTNNDYALSIQQTTDGGYIMGGWSQSFSSYHSTVLRLSAVGDTLWTRIFNGGGTSYGYSIRQTTDGGFIFLSTAIQQLYLIKMDANGNSGCNQGYAPAVVTPVTQVPTTFSSIYSGGTVTTPATLVHGGSIVTTNCFACNMGTVSFSGLPDSVCLNGTSSNLIGSPSGGIFSGAGISGNTFNPSVAGIGSHQIVYSYSLSSACNASDTSLVFVKDCSSSINNLSDEFSLGIYPNPVDEFLVIKNSFPGNETVTVKFFDVAGREVYSSLLKTSNQKLEIRNLENGIYFLQLKSNDKIFNQKFIVQH